MILRSAILFLASVCGLSSLSAADEPALQSEVREQAQPPNFVILLIDDAAFMDLGTYGGEAATPNIDALARRGVMFTRYYTSPLCAPSRAMLLTGIDNHQTGVATIPEVLPREHVGQPGYTMSLEPGVMTIAARLQPQGYRTLMTGKWHLGSDQGDLPSDHGFDRSFALDASGADNWDDKPYMPFYSEAPWYEDGKPADLPDDFYSSEFIVDRMIDYLSETDTSKPFFAYLGFQAVHIPVQAPAEITARYRDTYSGGWQEMREARWQRAKALGLIPADAPLAPLPDGMRRWEELSAKDRELYAARMAVNAAMLEAMDLHIGRLIEHLKASGKYDNTVFLVTSDNGPEPNRGDNDWRLKLWMKFNGYHLDLEGIGEKGSWGFIGPEFAMAAASPGNLFKFHGAEGGIHVPMIMAGPNLPESIRQDALVQVTDIAPTFLEMAGVEGESTDGVPMTGRSLVPLLAGEAEAVYGAEEPIGIEVSGNSALIRGHYKITRNQLPWGDAKWRLYDLASDPGEVNDLAAARPELMASMLADYEAYGSKVGVLEVPEGYDSHAILTHNTQMRQLRTFWWVPVLLLLVLIAVCWPGVRLLKSLRRSRPDWPSS
ncbi:arylsulfatase [Henriciella litoralis]|uniref:arylsulfatase n=1 Tax=Henriciella litoralis TaxID=568102 RepID=UPI001F19E7EA|nr:arylsulfatase [Henriciella litoralis]